MWVIWSLCENIYCREKKELRCIWKRRRIQTRCLVILSRCFSLWFLYHRMNIKKQQGSPAGWVSPYQGFVDIPCCIKTDTALTLVTSIHKLGLHEQKNSFCCVWLWRGEQKWHIIIIITNEQVCDGRRNYTFFLLSVAQLLWTLKVINERVDLFQN